MKRQKQSPANEAAELPGWLLGFFLVAVTLIAYHPACHAGFIWDDDLYVTGNPLLTAPDGLRRIWFSLDSPSQYFPLTYTTFYMERALWGLNPAGYHWVNLLLHAANVLLVWRVLARLRVPGAWLAAAIFALHPVQVESVAWITERKNVLMGFFFLLTLLMWIKFIDEQCKRPWRFYLLALVFYALALFAKTTACTLPAALLLILWLKKMPINWRRLGQVAPFVAMGIGMGLVTVWWENHHQGTAGKLFAIGPVERVLIANRALWFYAGKLLWPVNLTFSYPRWTISASDPRAYGWVLATAALGVVIWWARRRAGRSVEVAVVFFAVTLSPILGFIMLYTFQYSFVADHYQYLACIGPIALAAAGVELWSLVAVRRGAVLLVVLGVLTWRQCGMYANAETLWQTTLRRNPDCSMAHNNLGNIFLQKKQPEEAITQFEKALAINPANVEARNNLGNILVQEGKVDEAIAQYQKALEIQPDWADSHNNLGLALLQKGSVEEAIAQFQEALQFRPGYASAHNNLGNALFQKGEADEAISHFQKALQSEPDNAQFRVNLGTVLFKKGRVDEAISQFQQELQIHPDDADAQNNLGNILLQIGRADEAMSCFQRALEINPGLAAAHYNLGNALRQKGRADEAMLQYQNALQISPDYADAHLNLAIILGQKGRAAEAVLHFQKALQIAPANPKVMNNLAWLLATCPEASLRNGSQAVELARQANTLTGGENPIVLNTLAAALAEAGRFAEAVETAQRALRLAEAQSNAGLAAQLQSKINLYQAGQPFHTPAK